MRLADIQGPGVSPPALPGHGRPLKPKPTMPEGLGPQYKAPAGCTCGQNEKGTGLGDYGRGRPDPQVVSKGKGKEALRAQSGW